MRCILEKFIKFVCGFLSLKHALSPAPLLRNVGELMQPGVFVPRYHSGDVHIIDVSQAVEHDHPHALEFLRKDCANVNGEWTAFLFV